MNKVHNKVPVKFVEFTLRTNEKTEAKTLREWGNRDKNIVGSSKKEKIDYTYQRVNKKENFKTLIQWRKVTTNTYQVLMKKIFM